MSWISPTFGDFGGPSTPVQKKRRTTNVSTNEPSCISVSGSPSVLSSSNWLQKYCPRNVDELAVNIKKLNEIDAWLQQSCKSHSSSKVLLLSGVSGCGKTTALQVISRRLGFKILEWITPLDKLSEDSDLSSRTALYQNTSKQFQDFLFQSSRYGSCLTSISTKKLVLVKDFPNIFIHNPSKFHETIENIVEKCISPVVFISSDEGICRNLFPATLKESCRIHSISLNPIPDQRVIKVLKNLLKQECIVNKDVKMLPDDSIYAVASACQGDLRSAISKLYFCTVHSDFKISHLQRPSKLKKSKLAEEATPTEKDVKLDFFRGIGRILYPKKIESSEGLRFVHSTSDIVETFLSEPNKLVNQLFENYPSKLGNVNDLSNAASRLSNSDILMSRWQEKDIFHTYSLSVAVQGLMVSNKIPHKAKFEALKKSQTSRVQLDSKSLQMEGKSIFSSLRILDYESLLDILPFASELLPNLNQSQLEYVRKVCYFK